MPGMTKEDIDRIFKTPASRADSVGMQNIRALAKQLASGILDWTPSSPEQTLAIRKVQEAVLWSDANINLNEEPQ